MNAQRVVMLCADPVTTPTEPGVPVINDHGNRKWGTKTARVGERYLANLGKIDTGVVSLTSLWADEQLYYSLDVEPYTPAHHFAQGKTDPAFRMKLALGAELVRTAVERDIPFRAVAADSFCGEDHGFQRKLRELGVGCVLALKPSHAWWHLEGTIWFLREVAVAADWQSPTEPGARARMERSLRDGHTETYRTPVK